MKASMCLVVLRLLVLLIAVPAGAQTVPPDSTVKVPPGQPLPARAWVERPMPTGTIRSYMQTGGKHGRAFYHPGLKSMIFAGGDWHTTQPQFEGAANGTGSEIWAVNVIADAWTLLRPLCVAGEPAPGRPDTVGWAFDPKVDPSDPVRSDPLGRALMTPGFYFISQGGTSGGGCGQSDGWGGYAFEFTSKKFSGPDAVAGLPAPPGGWGGDTGASYGVVDPIGDEYLRVRNGPTLERLNLGKKTWNVQKLSNGNPNWNPIPNRAQLVIDVKGRALYWLDAWSTPRALIKINLGNGAIASIALPAQFAQPAAGDHEVYLAFDPGNRVVLVPNNFDMGSSPLKGLGIYHVDTGRWEWEAVPAAVAGSVWGFDEAAGALIGIGKRSPPFAYFLYKYTAGVPAGAGR